MTWLNTWLCGPGAHQEVIDELEVGARAAKVWSWGNCGIPTVPGAEHRLQAMPQRAVHYCPPDQYARIRREQAARDARRAEPAPLPEGQLDLFAGAA
jgi:hypothetical protein